MTDCGVTDIEVFAVRFALSAFVLITLDYTTFDDTLRGSMSAAHARGIETRALDDGTDPIIAGGADHRRVLATLIARVGDHGLQVGLPELVAVCPAKPLSPAVLTRMFLWQTVLFGCAVEAVGASGFGRTLT